MAATGGGAYIDLAVESHWVCQGQACPGCLECDPQGEPAEAQDVAAAAREAYSQLVARHQTEEREAEWLAQAKARGRQAGLAAASWAIDGNRDEQWYRKALALLDAGDPLVDEWMPALPDLSGEWADELTMSELAAEVVEPAHADDVGCDLVNDLATAWEAGRDEVFHTEVERLWRHAVGEEVAQ